ncbi:MAG: transglycosylase domain-containing protein [Anaerolineales bacterium]|jgi:penicillin-binding protein 1C|nr:transglycosylase domain-containing protein [Anaerolineales bacterium]
MTDPQEKTPPEFDPNRFAATRRLNPEESGLLPPNDESGTIFPNGVRSERTSPPPLYPEPGQLPLPERVNEIDLNATRVTPAAWQPTVQQRPPSSTPAPPADLPPASFDFRRGWGCFTRLLVIGLFSTVILALVGAIAGVLAYASIATTLPSVEDLRGRASQFETTRILDRNGIPLYEILDPNAGRRTYIPLEQISPYVLAATLATEDKEFYNHPGFDLVAIFRALWQNLTSGEIESGASTIPQQLARALLLGPEERFEQSYNRKIREVILAAEINRRYSKNEILELYLNENNYGNLTYGIEAASETYFNTSADQLTLAQASFLAGLPQSPAVHDIYTNREATLIRHRSVLVLMYTLSQERGCITVSNSPLPICVGVPDALNAAKEIEDYNFPRPDVTMRHPHWVQFVREQLEAQFGAQTIYRSGFTVYTSLDVQLQDSAQRIVSEQVAALVDKRATNGALVAIRPETGEILAMVGSADYYNEAIDGQVNMATTQTRQPGSSIKPLTYLAAFEKGWTPATLIWDVPSYFTPSGLPDDPAELYVPVNYDGKFHGPVTVRSALANSYNIPAVKTLAFVGVYDDPATDYADGLIGMAQRLGITSLTRNDYGLALTLGGGEVSVLEMTGAFSVIANNGKRIPPVAILKITDFRGDLVYEYQLPAGQQAIRPEHAFLMASILSDNEARAPMFGRNSLLNLPFPAAAKTGTSNDFRDNWTIGFTPDLAVGVWVGNADYTPMQNTTGLSGAAPIWSQFMQAAIPQITAGNPRPFARPQGIIDRVICAVSGTEPSKYCPQQRSEIFAIDQPPRPDKEDLWREEIIDTWSGLRATSACGDQFVKEEMTLNVSEAFARRWLRREAEGQNWAEAAGFKAPIFFTPDGECKANSPRPNLDFAGLRDGDVITEEDLDLKIIASGEDFTRLRLEFGYGDDPQEWQVLFESQDEIRQAEVIYRWAVDNLDEDRVTLRLRMENKNEGYAERLIHLRIEIPEPTPTPTLEPTFTPTLLPPSETPLLPTATPPPPTETPLPPSPSATPTP